jgi:hypothetical protein
MGVQRVRMRMRRGGSATRACLAAVLLFAGFGCASTRVVESWRNPEATPTRFRKVLAVAVVDDPDLRRRAEDEIISHLKAVDALPSRAVIPDAERGDVEKAKARLRDAGFEGAVVLRPLGFEERVTYVPPSYTVGPYPSFYGYYGYAWGHPYEPGYTRVDTILRVEVLIYSIERDALLWSGVTETFEPGSLRDVVSDIAAAVEKVLEREGLLVRTGS